MAGIVGLVGAVTSVAGFAIFAVAEAMHRNTDDRTYNDYGTSTYLAMGGTTLVLLLVTTTAPIGSLIGARGRSGGRAFAWAFLPLVFPAQIIGIAGTMSAVVESDYPLAVRIAGVVGTAGAVVGLVAALVAAVAWALPGARDFLIGRRRPDLAGRGRTTLLTVVTLAALALVLYGVAIALLVYGRQHLDLPSADDPYRYVNDDVPTVFLAGVIVAAVLLVTEAVLLAGALVTRSKRVGWLRGVTFGVAWMTLGGSVPAIVFLAAVWSIAGDNHTGDTAVGAGRVAFFVALAAGLLHLAALVLLAMPSVSAWTATRPPSPTTPGTTPTAPGAWASAPGNTPTPGTA
ncbi:hypothetical protein, partial [Cryptosporangium japonicum]|uniref:hypothetical protein n=1 Tax=Cryptosporangium japonicum TaxID=80872 RepID=UPI0031E1CF3C